MPKFIPLQGQGEPLPSDAPYSGQWLLENVLFLFQRDAVPTAGPEETAAFQLANGEVCQGIDAGKIGAGLGDLTAEEVLASNRTGALLLTAVHGMHKVDGVVRAKRYVFQIGSRETSIVMEAGPFGRA